MSEDAWQQQSMVTNNAVHSGQVMDPTVEFVGSFDQFGKG